MRSNMGSVFGTILLLCLLLTRSAVHGQKESVDQTGHLPVVIELDSNGSKHKYRPDPGHDPIPGRATTKQDGRQSSEPGLRLVRETNGATNNETSDTVFLTTRVHAELRTGSNAAEIGKFLGAISQDIPAYAPNQAVYQFPSPQSAWRAAEKLQTHPAVRSARVILAKPHSRRLIPADVLFPSQWGLLNTGQNGAEPGIDINVTNVWNEFRGEGVVVAVVDDGIQYTHPDLAAGVDLNLSHDYLEGDPDPMPTAEGKHGTPVAGIIGARGNNLIGVTGVAFNSTLAAIRLIGKGEGDDQEAASLIHSNQVISIYNNSWGGSDNGRTIGGLGPLLKQAIKFGITQGRQGRGNIYVWSSGNGGLNQDNINYDTYANNPYVIAVGSVNDIGHHVSYGEPGACLLICGPAGDPSSRPQAIGTTDLIGSSGFNSGLDAGDYSDRDYTRAYSGTSASAPFVSGVIALMLQANPQLGWRDVQEILIRSATRVDPLNSDWVINGAGLNLSHLYGAGLVNAGEAVKLSRKWINLQPELSLAIAREIATAIPIPDNTPSGLDITFDFSSADPNFRAEHVILTADIAHEARGDLAIRLTSPSGTTSRLAEKHADPNPNFPNHPFSSIMHWGEKAQGIWRARIVDLRAGSTGTLRNLSLEIRGSIAAPPPPPTIRILAPSSTSLVRFAVDGGIAATYDIEVREKNEQAWTVWRTTNAPAVFEFEDASVAFQVERYFRVSRKP